MSATFSNTVLNDQVSRPWSWSLNTGLKLCGLVLSVTDLHSWHDNFESYR